MSRYIILGAVILSLAVFSPSRAFQAVSGGGPGQKGKSAKTGPVSSSSSATENETVERGVVNIIVDRIEGGAIYSKDGQEYKMTGFTKVIDNSRSHPATRTKTAELSFANGSLVSVVLK